MLNELNILSELNLDFIVNAKLAFQDRNWLYLGLELYRGGDLQYHLQMRGRFSENEAKFVVACVLQGEISKHLAHAENLAI